MKKYIVTLTEEERKTLSDIASKGKQRSQKILNALILLGCSFRQKKQRRYEIGLSSCTIQNMAAG